MIQTLWNSLFNIRYMLLKTKKMFIDNLESQNTCATSTLKCEFSYIFFCAHWHSGRKAPWTLYALNYHYLGSTLNSHWISQDMFDYIIILYPSHPVLPPKHDCDYARSIYSGRWFVYVITDVISTRCLWCESDVDSGDNDLKIGIGNIIFTEL